MTLDHHSGVLTIERLGPANLIEAFGYLDREPVLNVYLLALTLRDALAKPRDEFWAARREGEMVGVLHMSGQSGAILPLGHDPQTLELLAEQAHERASILPGRYQIIGPRAAVGALAARFEQAGIRPRLARNQVYMILEREALKPFERLAELKRAAPEDYDLIHESGAQLRAEELEEDPRLVDPSGYAKRVEEECRDGYTYLWQDQEGLCFRAGVSAVTPDAAQVSGVYTPPDRRNRGLARRGLAELCARLLDRSRTVCLFVNDFNAPALALYQHLGFAAEADWASAFYGGSVCA